MKDRDPTALSHDSPEALHEVIEAFCNKYEIAGSTFGRLAVNDGKFLGRIASGGRVEPRTAQRVSDFMARADRGEVTLRGRPRRKKSESNAAVMAEMISRETSIRTPGSFAFYEQRHRFHVFANTTNEAWVLADRIAEDLVALQPQLSGIKLFYAPMDNGITLNRTLRALHARFPEIPVLVVLKGRGLEDLRNTMGRLVDRMAEHPLSVFAMTNMYVREALDLVKTSDDNPKDVTWRDVALAGSRSYDFQNQVSTLYETLSREWLVYPGTQGQPVYAQPSVLILYREDHKKQLEHIIPRQGQTGREYDLCLLNHPYLHTHTMRFRIDHVLGPVARALAPGGQMTVIQAHGTDPAHEIVQNVWPDQPLPVVSRYGIIKALRQGMGKQQREYSFTGLTDSRSLFRFDMHTLPVIEGHNLGALSLSSAWNNAVYFAQVKEELAQAAIREGSHYLDVTRDVLQKHGGLWFVDESFSVVRKVRD